MTAPDPDDRRAELRAAVRADKVRSGADAEAAHGYEPFPVDALPSPVREYVAEYAEALGVDAAMIALPTLAMLAACIGTTRTIALAPTWSEPAVLWCAVVARSGERKSPALDAALAPLRDVQAKALREWQARNRDRSEGDGEPEPAPRYIVSDITREGLAKRLAENPRGLLCARDELAAWFGSHGAYKAGRGGDVEGWLEMHGARSLIVDRKGEDHPTFIPRAAVSLCGTIQPRVLAKALGESNVVNGLAARLLLAAPPARVNRWTEATVSDATMTRMRDLVDALLALEPETTPEAEARPVAIPLGGDTKRAWIGWFDQFALEQADEPDDAIRAMLAKLEGGAARLALILHFARWAAGGSTATPWAIDLEAVLSGTRLAEWLAREGRRIYADMAASEAQRADDDLVAWITKRDGSVTVRDLSTSGPRRYRGDPDAARAALDRLVKAGRGAWDASARAPSNGRPSERFTLYRRGSETPDHGAR